MSRTYSESALYFAAKIWHLVLYFIRMLLFTAFCDKSCTCTENSIGCIILYDKSPPTLLYEGIILVCVDVNGIAEKAEILIEEDSTLNDGAAAAACRQKGYVDSAGPISSSK